MNIINLTPHDVVLNDGTTFPPSGKVARVTTNYYKVGGIFTEVSYGEVVNLPPEQPDTVYIVSAIVSGATDRKDVVCPATSHPKCIRNEKGQIVSVPYLIIKKLR